jgi:hypothetical protein
MTGLVHWGAAQVERARRSPTVRLVVLTLYYLAIIVGLGVGGGRHDTHPPFVYQAF